MVERAPEVVWGSDSDQDNAISKDSARYEVVLPNTITRVIRTISLRGLSLRFVIVRDIDTK